MVIIVVHVGSPTFLKGDIIFSIPSAKEIGEVVRVSNEVPVIKNINLKAIKLLD